MIQAQWSASEAKRVLAAAARSGLSIEAYGRAQGISPQRLYWWRKRLRDQRAERGPSDSTALVAVPKAMSFVELAAEPELHLAPIEVVLANGRIVRVPSSFDDGALLRVLSVADGAA